MGAAGVNPESGRSARLPQRGDSGPLPVGVSLRELRVITDARGAVLHMVRTDQADASAIAEVYFSEVAKGVTKGWKRHASMTQRVAVPVGRVLFTLYDDREHSPTRGTVAAVTLGRPEHYELLTIPPGIWYAFTAIDGVGLIANAPDLVHDPAEAEHRQPGVAGMPNVL